MTSFHGIFTPLITPLQSDESPDIRSLQSLVQMQIENGVHGLWVMGTSAEFASFDEDERASCVEAVLQTVSGRIPVIANASDASTRMTIRHGLRAQRAGVQAIAATPPYYYPHSQEELLDHYRAIRDAIDLPLFIYNIPQTVRVKVELSTATTLAAEGTVNGIKDSQNDLEWFRQLTLFVRRRQLQFASFAGTRHLIDAAVLAGADGAIPSLANAFPALCVEAYTAARSGRFHDGRASLDHIVELEGIPALLHHRSRNAATLGFLKSVLQHHGIIASAALTSPLRSVSMEEEQMLIEKLQVPLPITRS